MFISIFSVVALLSCGSILTMPNPMTFSKQDSLARRQVVMVGMMSGTKNGTMVKMNMTGAGMSEAEKEAREEAAEKLPGLNTIANAYKELYYHDKYGSQRSDTATLVRMAGQAVGSSAPGGDPEVVAKAILLVYEPYTAKVPSNAPSPKGSNAKNATEPPSLNTIAHTLHEIWEKMVEGTAPKPDNAILVQTIGQAIASSSTSGDPAVVAKAIETAAAKVIPA